MKLKTSCTTRLFRSMRDTFFKIGYPINLLHPYTFDFYIGLASLPGKTHEARICLLLPQDRLSQDSCGKTDKATSIAL